ncbi:phage terminase small subunit P27 family [Rubinisphaera sp.]|uniref:phage terminase small subunit P27 family n=1 Tax=Rubinisphaera sp. TaxID=2024857 RepID=UPI000C101509|nr:phage terminase small subunit P27 family [Rubinisphaera sp.]MBV07671.1 phage terminase small subunit P27 family [Rubinisphaera sp.]
MAGRKGRSGRKKTPTQTKELRGTNRNDRRKTSLTKTPGVPLAPEDLDDDIQQEWNRLAPVLVEFGLLTNADLLAFDMGMRAYQMWRNANAELQSIDQIQFSENGNPYAHPLVWIEKAHYERVLKFCDRFGMTPSARNGLEIQTSEEEHDPLEDALG